VTLPKPEEVPPYLNFAPLENGLDEISRAANHYKQALGKIREEGKASAAETSLQSVNQELIRTERALTTPAGLPRRPWFKHEIYAPGYYTGYDVKTIPAVREAIEQKQWKDADQAIIVVGKVFQDEARVIETAAGELDKALQ
jgi:N-acetylated-alpha-linked acidic dipeptidase